MTSNSSQRLDQSDLPLVAATPASLHGKIAELEALVISLKMVSNEGLHLVNQTRNDNPNASHALQASNEQDADGDPMSRDPARVSDDLGRINRENDTTSYADGAHWSVILDKIAELRDHFENDSARTERHALAPEVPEIEEPELLFGGYKHASKEEILAAVPSRPLVDRLVANCFERVDIAPMIIHSPTFTKEYEKFWKNPRETPVMWIGLLFAMVCVATVYEQFSPIEAAAPFQQQPTPEPKHLISTYREKIVQCLILANYAKCSSYTIETLLLYLHTEYVRNEDTQVACWVLLGVIIRLALCSGYHVDGSHYPNISLLNVEMRRRTWIVISMLDIFTSAKVGLPRMIKDMQCDTVEPHNFLDEDLDDNMIELPDARPVAVQTPVQFLVAKHQIASVFGRIIDLTNCKPSCSYEEVMSLDKALNDAHNAVPQWLVIRSTAEPAMDSPEVIMRRIDVNLNFHKARIFLHRKYLLQARTDATFKYSRMACIDAALKILNIQGSVDQEMQIGGQLYQDRQKVSSLVKHESLLATMILCIDFDHGLDELSSAASENNLDLETKDKVMKALNDSYFIWLRSSESSKEAREAVEVLRVVLGKAQESTITESRGMEIIADGEIDESLLQRPQPLNYMPTSRRLRGPMALPQLNGDRWGDGDLAAALEMDGGPEDADTVRSGYQTPNWGDVLGMTKDFQQKFSSPLSGLGGYSAG